MSSNYLHLDNNSQSYIGCSATPYNDVNSLTSSFHHLLNPADLQAVMNDILSDEMENSISPSFSDHGQRPNLLNQGNYHQSNDSSNLPFLQQSTMPEAYPEHVSSGIVFNEFGSIPHNYQNEFYSNNSNYVTCYPCSNPSVNSHYFNDGSDGNSNSSSISLKDNYGSSPLLDASGTSTHQGGVFTHNSNHGFEENSSSSTPFFENSYNLQPTFGASTRPKNTNSKTKKKVKYHQNREKKEFYDSLTTEQKAERAKEKDRLRASNYRGRKKLGIQAMQTELEEESRRNLDLKQRCQAIEIKKAQISRLLQCLMNRSTPSFQ